MLDENISYVDFQYQFVWEHFRVKLQQLFIKPCSN